MNVRTLQWLCKKGQYQIRFVQGNGGKRYEILVSSLEPELRQRVSAELTRSATQSGEIDCTPPLRGDCAAQQYPLRSGADSANCFADWHPLRSTDSVAPAYACDKAKVLARAKVDLICHWQSFRADKKNKKQADKDFIDMYNTQNLSVGLFNIIGKVSLATLYRWNKLYKESDNDYRTLIATYNCGFENDINTVLTEREQKEFVNIMLNPNRFNAGKAYDIVKYNLEREGLTVASKSAYYRFIKNYKRNNKDIWTFMREGNKALIDEVMPYNSTPPLTPPRSGRGTFRVK
ncbi:MAG: hypothetical protein LUB59_06575 [Candidatus Gastranaerophilales bacterium]|nr:hypothetical protein [Candidatus Gastranaerophilales bacterium]